MRYAAWLAGAGALVGGCGESGTTLLDRGTPTAGDAPPGDVAVVSPGDAVVGPICADCITAGGETSDFDGGRDPCAQFIRTIALTDAEASLAGFDVAAYRQRLERPFEAPLRWTDLTSTSALPRSAPIVGYDPATTVRGSITARGVSETFFDTATCDAERRCESLYGDSRLDCSHFAWTDVYGLAARVLVTTGDGALDGTLDGFLSLQPEGPPALENATQGSPLTFSSHADIATVRGTLRIEPPPAINRGSVSLYLALLDGAVRGRLEMNFTTGWRELPGVGLAPLDDQPLVAALQDDDCPFNVTPLPIAEPSHVLGGQTPADALGALRSRIADTAPVGVWTHVGACSIGRRSRRISLAMPRPICRIACRFSKSSQPPPRAGTRRSAGSSSLGTPSASSCASGLVTLSLVPTSRQPTRPPASCLRSSSNPAAPATTPPASRSRPTATTPLAS